MTLKEFGEKYTPPDPRKHYKIDDFDQKNRSILEQGINLLRYGMNEDGIKQFFTAVREDPEMAEYISTHMNVWGSGFEYE